MIIFVFNEGEFIIIMFHQVSFCGLG